MCAVTIHSMSAMSKSLLPLCGVLLATALLALVSWVGVWDPQPIGTLAMDERLGLVVGERWLEAVDGPFTVRVEIASAEKSALILKNKAETLHIAVDPVGFVSIWRIVEGKTITVMPWQTWPHVQLESNALWLDVDDGAWSLRINRELFYEGAGWIEPVTEVGMDAGVSAEVSRIQLFK